MRFTTTTGHTYRSTVSPMDGVFMVSLSKENRAAAGGAGGEVVEADIELDGAGGSDGPPLAGAEAVPLLPARPAHQ